MDPKSELHPALSRDKSRRQEGIEIRLHHKAAICGKEIEQALINAPVIHSNVSWLHDRTHPPVM